MAGAGLAPLAPGRLPPPMMSAIFWSSAGSFCLASRRILISAGAAACAGAVVRVSAGVSCARGESETHLDLARALLETPVGGVRSVFAAARACEQLVLAHRAPVTSVTSVTTAVTQLVLAHRAPHPPRS